MRTTQRDADGSSERTEGATASARGAEAIDEGAPEGHPTDERATAATVAKAHTVLVLGAGASVGSA